MLKVSSTAASSSSPSSLDSLNPYQHIAAAVIDDRSDIELDPDYLGVAAPLAELDLTPDVATTWIVRTAAVLRKPDERHPPNHVIAFCTQLVRRMHRGSLPPIADLRLSGEQAIEPAIETVLSWVEPYSA